MEVEVLPDSLRSDIRQDQGKEQGTRPVEGSAAGAAADCEIRSLTYRPTHPSLEARIDNHFIKST